MNPIDIRRNDPCLCGSRKKYKRCCLQRVEDQIHVITKALDDPAQSYQAKGLVEVLGLVAGVQPDEDEVVPVVEDLVEAANKVFAALDDEDILLDIHDSLVEVLKKPEFRLLRFRPRPLVKALGQNPVVRARLDGQGSENDLLDEEVRDRVISDAIRRQVTSDFVADAVWKFIFCLRRPETSKTDYAPIIWGLWMALDRREVGSNPLWVALFELTLEELAAGEAAMGELAEKYSSAGSSSAEEANEELKEEIETIFHKYPLLQKELSQRVLEDLRPALEAIYEERINLKIPLYAVINGVVDLFGYWAEKVKEARSAGTGAETKHFSRLDELLPNAGEDYLKVLMRDLWDRDYDVFVASVREQLQSWLTAYQASLEQEQSPTGKQRRLSSSVEKLIELVGGYILDVERFLFMSLYLQGMGNALGDRDLKEILNSEGLEAYAENLEGTGLKAAAENVRKAAENIKGLDILEFLWK